MPGKVGTTPPVTGFDRLDKAAEGPKESVKTPLTDPARTVKQSTKAVIATSSFVETLQAVPTGGHAAVFGGELAPGGEVAPGGTAGWESPDVRKGGRDAARGAASGWGAMVNLMPRVGAEHLVTVRKIQSDPMAMRFTELSLSTPAQSSAYSAAIWSLSTTPETLALAGNHTANVASNLAKRAALTTSSSATRLGEYGARLGAAGLEAAEAGAGGARELTLLSTRLSAATASVIANSDQIKEAAAWQLAGFRAQLVELTKTNPDLLGHVKGLLAA